MIDERVRALRACGRAAERSVSNSHCFDGDGRDSPPGFYCEFGRFVNVFENKLYFKNVILFSKDFKMFCFPKGFLK